MESFDEKLTKPEEEKDVQGSNASEAFAGNARESLAISEMYGESAELFANIFREELKKINGKDFSMADFGAYKGELLAGILARLQEFHIKTVAIEKDQNALNQNKIAQEKICADLKNIPLSNESVDVAFMRYVLQWNELESQERIVKELHRIIKNMAIIQHLGPDDLDAKQWRESVGNLLSGEIVRPLKRQNYFFSSCEEVESIFNKLGVGFEKIQERVIQNLSETFIIKFGLGGKEADSVKNALKNTDYIVQTAFIIRK